MASDPHHVAFALVDNFTLSPVTLAVDTLRLANYVSNAELFRWSMHGRGAASVVSSSGVALSLHGDFNTIPNDATVVVGAGIGIEAMDTTPLVIRLRDLAAHGAQVGAVCLGTFVLADAGLLDGHVCTTHWEYIVGLRERHPHLRVTEELFEADDNRFSCAGGTAALDLMLNFVARRFGTPLANGVTDALIHHRMREKEEHQRMTLRLRLGVAHPAVIAAVALMERHLEDTLSCEQIAQQANLSARQLERLFASHVGDTPARFYLRLRLERARHLLRQTTLSVTQVALACGFSAFSHFSACYGTHFGRPPSSERRVAAMSEIRQEPPPRKRAHRAVGA